MFVNDLASAYSKYAKSLDLEGDILFTDHGHIILKFEGKSAGKYFINESGKHCVQRIPPTETKGRTQTSMVCVAILPIPPDTSLKPLPDSELEIITQRGHGKGGQHQNKTDSAVRMTHKPTGLQVFINGRDQHANKREALKILTARVNEIENEEKVSSYSNIRKMQMDGGGRSNKIRTYNFKENRAVDHRSGAKTTKVREVIERGRFDLLK